MKPYLLTLLLIGASHTLMAQNNPDKAENARYERDRKFNATHHIKQLKLYKLKTENEVPADSTLFGLIKYDKKGNITQVIRYIPNAAAINREHHTDTDT